VIFLLNELISYCGLNCKHCPAYNALKTDDQNLREKTAKEWSSDQFTISPDQVNCNSCHSSDTLFFHCSKCEVRTCASNKGITTCAECESYPCTDKLQALWNNLNVPHAKENLDKLRN